MSERSELILWLSALANAPGSRRRTLTVTVPANRSEAGA
jgi:hypothetical protein